MTRVNSSRACGRVLLAAWLLALTGLLPASAQRSYPTPKVYNPGVYSRTRQTMSNRAAARAALERKRQTSTTSNAPGPRPTTSTSTQTTAAGSVTFRPVADQIMPRQMAFSLSNNPEEQRRLEALFSEALGHYRNRLKQAGLPLNDVSRAAAYLVTASYYVSNDGHASLDEAQLVALRKYLSEAFARDETFQRMSDRERQELFEDYGITATWIDAGFNLVKEAGDREGVRQWREMARQNFTAILGAPPESVVFTSRGVQFK